eukprot:Selendium_serpulae@DN6305_c0_g1_i11.p1
MCAHYGQTATMPRWLQEPRRPLRDTRASTTRDDLRKGRDGRKQVHHHFPNWKGVPIGLRELRCDLRHIQRRGRAMPRRLPPSRVVVHQDRRLTSRCHLSAVYSCPAGYELNGTTCSKSQSYDCSTTEHDIVCDEPAVGKDAHLRSLAPEDLKAKYKTAEYGARHPLPVCHKVPRTVAKTCEKTITAQAEAYCANGLLRSGNRCEIINYSTPDQVCDATSGPNGECFVTETSAPIRSCPSGYTNEGTRCVKVITSAPEWTCPSGTTGPNCVDFADKVCPGGEADRCETTISEPVRHICPSRTRC